MQLYLYTDTLSLCSCLLKICTFKFVEIYLLFIVHDALVLEYQNIYINIQNVFKVMSLTRVSLKQVT